MGFSKSSSSSDSGAYDSAKNRNPSSGDYNSQMKYDFLTERLFGKPVYAQGGGSAPTTGGGTAPSGGYQWDAKSQQYYGPGGVASKTLPPGASAQTSGGAPGAGQAGQQTGFEGGLFDQLMGQFGKNSVYSGADSGYTATEFKPSQLGETSLNPDEYNTYADLITKGAKKTGAANIAKYNDQAAYKGTGDLANYFAQQENRNVMESVADQQRQLSADYMGKQFNNRSDVAKYNADSAYNAQLDTDSSRQRKSELDMDFFKNKLGESQYGMDSLMQLGELLAGFTDQSKRGSSSKSSSMGVTGG